MIWDSGSDSDCLSGISGQKVLEKLKYQLKEANAEIERLKSEVFSYKERLIHAEKESTDYVELKKENLQLSNTIQELETKCKELSNHNISLQNENLTLKRNAQDYQNNFMRMNQSPPMNFNIPAQIMPINDNITALMNQQRMELQIRDQQIKNLLNTQTQNRAIPIVRDKSYKPNDEITREKFRIQQEFEMKQQLAELQKENIILKHKCKELSRSCLKYRKTIDENKKNSNQIVSHQCHADEILTALLQKESYEKKIHELQESLANEKDKTYKLSRSSKHKPK